MPSPPAMSAPVASRSRRALHVPFFPFSPAEPPSGLPSNPIPTAPFFPSYSSPSPPPPLGAGGSSQPTFPANISSLTFPGSRSAPRSRHSYGAVAAAVVLPLLALGVLAAVAVAFFVRRHRRRFPGGGYSDKDESRSVSDRLFPADFAASDDGAPKPSPPSVAASSDFLYFGTFVDAGRVGSVRDGGRSTVDPVGGSPSGNPASPELRPLPPLQRQFRHMYENGTIGSSSEEEFYSPKMSSAGKESSGRVVGRLMSNSRLIFPSTVEKSESRGLTMSTPSYPSSNLPSSPQSSPTASVLCVGSSPGHQNGGSLKSRSERSVDESIEFEDPQPPPPPPPLLGPLTPSPPKRNPPSPSPPSSPVEKQHETKAKIRDMSAPNVLSPTRNQDLSCNPFIVITPPGPRQRQAPPPPPPPPPVGYWDSQVRKPQDTHLPILAKSVPAEVMISSAMATDPKGDSEAMEKNQDTSRPKLKPLHWDKVQASSNRAMVWDQLKSSSFQVNEEMIETLFVSKATNPVPRETNWRQVLPPPNQENKVLDPKKSQNIAILLRALNVTTEEVCDALLEGNADSLGTELLETLLKMAPSKEEEHKLKEHKDDAPTKLGPPEKFLKALLDIPFAFKRIDGMLYIANFDSEVNFLKKSFETLEAACDELRNSGLFMKLLDAVLKTGNRMNVGTNRGDAHAFKLDTLLKLVDVKGTDGKTTLLHFVVQEIIRSEGSRLSIGNNGPAKAQPNTLRYDLECRKLGLKTVSALGGELSNVKKAAAMDSDILSSYVSKLAGGIGKINELSKLNGDNQRFHEAMVRFLKKAEDDIIRVQAQESVALSLVKEITEYFHGNSTREEAHPFRIFMVVRDFLAILERVCKEVGTTNEHTIVSSARRFPVPVNPTLPPLFPRFHALRPEGSDEESSLSS